MPYQIIDISNDDFYLKKYRGFLEIKKDDCEIAKIPLDDIIALIITAQKASFSKNIIISLSQLNIITVLCGSNYMPEAIVLPTKPSPFATGHPMLQARASKALNGRLWQQIIKQKILNQYNILQMFDKDKHALSQLKKLQKSVRTHDTENNEAYAARIYFSALFGEKFKRDTNIEGINSQLNYGYTVLRSLVARSICAAGLSPAIGIFHQNKRNGFCLADDLMEPFRPLVDMLTYKLPQHESLDSFAKEQLCNLIYYPIITDSGQSKLYQVINKLTKQLAKVYYNQQGGLIFYDWCKKVRSCAS